MPATTPRSFVEAEVTKKRATVVEIAIGTPAQKFRCLLDTGSADILVPSKMCDTCGSAARFDANQSSTFSPQLVGDVPQKVHLSSRSGRFVGYEAQETLVLGDLELKNQTFVIVEGAELPEGAEWDAICGLGWKGMAKAHKPLYERLQEEGQKALFAIVPTSEAEASLEVGELPEGSYREGSLVWVDAEATSSSAGGRWVAKGGVAIQKREPTKVRFMVDTSTSQALLVPPQHFEAFMKSLIPEDAFDSLCGQDDSTGNLVVCDCSIVEKVPKPLRLHLGNASLNVTAEELFAKAPSAHGGDELCVLQIQPSHMGAAGLLGGLLNGIAGGLLGELGEPGVHAGDGNGIEWVDDGLADAPLGGGLLGGLEGGLVNLNGSLGGLADALNKSLSDAINQSLNTSVRGGHGGGPFDGSLGGLADALDNSLGDAFNQSLNVSVGKGHGSSPFGAMDPFADAGSIAGLINGVLNGTLNMSEALSNSTLDIATVLNSTLSNGSIAHSSGDTAQLNLSDIARFINLSNETGVETVLSHWTKEVRTVTKPDGSLCTSTLEKDHDGKVVKNETQCTNIIEDGSKSARRLQFGNMQSGSLSGVVPAVGGMPGATDIMGGAMPLLDAPGGAGAALDDDLWVLGGAFLDRYVVVLDFDSGKLGFADPTVKVKLPDLDEIGHAGGGESGVPPAQQFFTKAEGPATSEVEAISPETWVAMAGALAALLSFVAVARSRGSMRLLPLARDSPKLSDPEAGLETELQPLQAVE